MATYLCVKASSTTKRYTAKSTSEAGKTYLRVKDGYFPLTTETTSGVHLNFKYNGQKYRIVETFTTTQQITVTTGTSYLTQQSTSGTSYKTRSSTSKTTYYTRSSTSNTTYGTRSSTSGTSYETRSSTSNTSYFTTLTKTKISSDAAYGKQSFAVINISRIETLTTTTEDSNQQLIATTITFNSFPTSFVIPKGIGSFMISYTSTSLNGNTNSGVAFISSNNQRTMSYTLSIGTQPQSTYSVYSNFTFTDSRLLKFSCTLPSYELTNANNASAPNIIALSSNSNLGSNGRIGYSLSSSSSSTRSLYGNWGYITVSYYTRNYELITGSVSTTATSYYTRRSTSTTVYLTRKSTSETGYATRSSTSKTSYLTRSSTSATEYLTQSSTYDTVYLTITSSEQTTSQ